MQRTVTTLSLALSAAVLCTGCGGGETGAPTPVPTTEASGTVGTPASPVPSATAPPVPSAAAPTPVTTSLSEVGGGGQARYTSLTGCTLLRSNPEEAGFAESRCPGVGGYGLLLVDADARQNLMLVRPDGTRHSLRIPELGGGGFGSLGRQVEWRTLPGSDRPRAVIARYSVMEDPDPKVPERSYLFVATLDGARPCVVAKVAPGPDQNARARAAADRGGRCLAT